MKTQVNTANEVPTITSIVSADAETEAQSVTVPTGDGNAPVSTDMMVNAATLLRAGNSLYGRIRKLVPEITARDLTLTGKNALKVGVKGRAVRDIDPKSLPEGAVAQWGAYRALLEVLQYMEITPRSIEPTHP